MFAKRLSSLRLKKKLTQQNMADKLGITRPAYTSYESGKRKPDYDSLNKIADILNTSVSYLLGRTSNPMSDKDIDVEEQAEFESFINNPEHGLFFKEYLEAPEERKKELMIVWRIIKEAEKGRKLENRQD